MRLQLGLVVCLVAVTSLALKLSNERRVANEDMLPRIDETIKSALVGQKYELFSQTRKGLVGGFKDSCVVWISPSRPEGGDNTSFSLEYGASANVIYWYDKQLYKTRPATVSLLKQYFDRIQAAMTGYAGYEVLYQIAYSDSCSTSSLAELKLGVGERQ